MFCVYAGMGLWVGNTFLQPPSEPYLLLRLAVPMALKPSPDFVTSKLVAHELLAAVGGGELPV